MTPTVTVPDRDRDLDRDHSFRRMCPVCDAPLDEGQGLFACTACDWTGTVTRARRGLHWVTDWK